MGREWDKGGEGRDRQTDREIECINLFPVPNLIVCPQRQRETFVRDRIPDYSDGLPQSQPNTGFVKRKRKKLQLSATGCVMAPMTTALRTQKIKTYYSCMSYLLYPFSPSLCAVRRYCLGWTKVAPTQAFTNVWHSIAPSRSSKKLICTNPCYFQDIGIDRGHVSNLETRYQFILEL